MALSSVTWRHDLARRHATRGHQLATALGGSIAAGFVEEKCRGWFFGLWKWAAGRTRFQLTQVEARRALTR
jgi:hypothetical protein